ncbi:MAG: protein kinase, partial [Chloroflexota bacterium]
MASTDKDGKGGNGINSPGSSGGAGIGRVLNGRYSLIAPVGGGGMATVYKARDNILGRIVAVKILREQYAGDGPFVTRFRREAQAAANLTHPNIVSVYDVGQDTDIHYIVMEFVAGQSLKELINKAGGGPLTVDRAVNIAAQILAGLEYAHRSGLIHRDIKPQNVLITGDGTVKVTDFGIAKSVSDLSLTDAGMALGTAHYFSPEQAKGERVGPQSDIYSLGVTLYEMLTGKLPFESENSVGLAYKHISEPPPSPRALNPNIPLRLEAIVLKSMAKDPAQRFSSAAEMERSLRSLQLSGQQATAEINVPRAKTNVTSPGTRITRGQLVAGSQGASTIGLRGATGSLRSNTGQLRSGAAVYPIPAGGDNGGAGVSARNLNSPLGGPTSMAIRPSAVRVQGAGLGCSPAAIALLILSALALVSVLGFTFFPQIWNLVTPSEVVIPSPTPTPTVPTSTPTSTFTSTPTATSTSTPTATSTPVSVAVPKLIGLSLNDATVLAKQKGFVLLNVGDVESIEFAKGLVAQQDPPPDAILQQTKQIAVRISTGPPSFVLPDLSNTDPTAAKTLLEG